ncbi:MAG: PepSY-like domain-containing protein [Crocinitomicaceae bacterium]|nr:PepSY-like domain-containing protein [Crocinitomicaceae bacterium]
MKTIKFLSLAALLVAFTGCSKEKGSSKEVPTPVKTSFANNFPNAQNEKWSKDGSDYEVEFENDRVEYEVVFDAKGNILQTEKEVDIESLPSKVKIYLAENFAQHTPEGAVLKSEGGKDFYEVEYESEGKEIELVFDSNGNFIEQDTDEENDDLENENEDEEENDDQD